MGSHDPIAYTYDADTHCPTCAEARFGRTDDGFIAGQNDDGTEDVDSEGNRVGIIAPWDSWCQEDDECETLVCGTCGGEIDTAHADPHSPGCSEYEPPETNATIQGVFEATDDGDEWGHNREVAFGIAYTLYFREEDVPSAWEFNPGAATEETMECFVAELLLAEYDAGTITGDDLREFGNMLDTEGEAMRAAGKSY